MMKTVRLLPTGHDEYIHDIKYDYYGRRLVSVSSDQRVKIWDLDENDKWVCTAQWKAHSGSVWKAEWAHPEFGQLIATCSFDRTVCIWEETTETTALSSLQQQQQQQQSSASAPGQSPSSNPSQMSSSPSPSPTSSSNPNNNGPSSATSPNQASSSANNSNNSNNNTAPNANNNNGNNGNNNSSSNGNTSMSASNGSSSNAIYGTRRDLHKRSTWILRSSLGDSRETVQDIKFAPKHQGLRLATCSADGRVRIYEPADSMNLSTWSPIQDFVGGKRGVNCISWNPSSNDPPMLVVGCNSDEADAQHSNLVTIWQYDGNSRQWNILMKLNGHLDSVYDVAWAPFMGRQYHLIASASKDKTVRIWQLSRGDYEKSNQIGDAQSWTLKSPMTELREHGSEVWRVEWNVLGTVLASSGDDGGVRLWKMSRPGEWQEVSSHALQ